MSQPLIMSCWVGLGGFAGSVARYGLSLASQRAGVTRPLGTLGANVLGCLAIGLVAGLSERGLPPAARLALATGFCGGFTTMSSLIHEAAAMARGGASGRRRDTLAGTLALSAAGFAAGLVMVRAPARLGGGAWNWKAEARLLRIFLGEGDQAKHAPLYEAIVREARAAGLAGATAWRGVMGFGPTSRIRTAKVLDLSADLPVVVRSRMRRRRSGRFLPVLKRLFETAWVRGAGDDGEGGGDPLSARGADRPAE